MSKNAEFEAYKKEAKGHCKLCGELVGIVPGELQNTDPTKSYSSRWWHTVLHPDNAGGICLASGDRV